MKILLTLIICSSIAGDCIDPYQWPETFRTNYDCLMFGYEESMNKLKEVGRDHVNKYGMFIKFYCEPINTI